MAKSANKLDVTGSVTIKEHHLLPEIFSEEESGPEDDTPEAIQEFSEHGKPLQVGEFYLTHSKPYLSSAVSHIHHELRIFTYLYIGHRPENPGEIHLQEQTCEAHKQQETN